MLEKKELIRKFLLDGNPEEKRRKFEIAWDIWKALPEILGEQSLVIFKKLKEKIEKNNHITLCGNPMGFWELICGQRILEKR